MRPRWNDAQGRSDMADRFDLDAIAADDALLDLLGAGGESAQRAGAHDPAVMLLAQALWLSPASTTRLASAERAACSSRSRAAG